MDGDDDGQGPEDRQGLSEYRDSDEFQIICRDIDALVQLKRSRRAL
jgi:hypothetical protein